MTVTVQIETNTAAGLKLISELRRYPDIVRVIEPDQISELRRYPDIVRVIEPDQISEPVREGFVSVKDGFDELRNHVKSLYQNNSQTK